MKGEKPKQRNSPTKSAFKNLEMTGDIEVEKAKWLKLVEEYTSYTENNFVHWFYGKMTKEQVGFSVYKHIDHHHIQFNS